MTKLSKSNFDKIKSCDDYFQAMKIITELLYERLYNFDRRYVEDLVESDERAREKLIPGYLQKKLDRNKLVTKTTGE